MDGALDSGNPILTVRSFVALKEPLKQSDSGVTWGQFSSSGGGISEKNIFQLMTFRT